MIDRTDSEILLAKEVRVFSRGEFSRKLKHLRQEGSGFVETREDEKTHD